MPGIWDCPALGAQHTCGRVADCINDGHVEVGLGEGRIDGAHDAPHLAEGVLIAVLHLKVIPRLPKVLVCGRVCQAGGVHVDGARAIHFAHILLKLGIPALVWHGSDSLPFPDSTGPGYVVLNVPMAGDDPKGLSQAFCGCMRNSCSFMQQALLCILWDVT